MYKQRESDKERNTQRKRHRHIHTHTHTAKKRETARRESHRRHRNPSFLDGREPLRLCPPPSTFSATPAAPPCKSNGMIS